MRFLYHWQALLILTLLLSLAIGCRKELCYKHPHDGSVTVNVDWRNLPSDAKKPNGVRVVFVDQPRQSQSYTFNFPAEGGSRDVGQGNYNVLVVNNDPELVLFRGMTIWETMEGFTPAKRHNAYKSPPANVPSMISSSSRIGISAADMLISSNAERLHVSEQSGVNYVVNATPRSYVKKITVRIPVSGVKSVSEARGFLTGVSQSVFLGIDSLNQADATLLFEYGSAMAGTELRSEFMIFGMTDHPVGYYKLGLEILLVDQSVLYYDFDVSNQITEELKLNGGVIRLSKTILIPDVDPPTPGGGFHPGIGGWGEEEDIIIGNI